MRLFQIFAIPLLMILSLASVVPIALAATATPAPMCFCYITNKGADKEPDIADARQCQAKCVTNPDYEGYLWAESYASYPGANLRCWQKEADCQKDMDGDEKQTIDGVWSRSQPAECIFGQHYCYAADTSPTYLNVSIAGKESVINFAEYIGVVYNYLMGFSMTVAIVFLMVGGLQYVVAGGSVMKDDKETITGAKQMMKNAVEGFVILMFVYVILYTVNPQLIKLQVPKLPMLRQVLIGGNDCATLLGLAPTDKPGTIDENTTFTELNKATDLYGKNALISTKNHAVLKFEDEKKRKAYECGTIAEIMTGPEQAPTVEGMTCQFNYCAPDKGGCATLPTGNKCMMCEEIGPGDKSGAIPSASLCSDLDPADTYTTNAGKNVVDQYNLCGYTHDPYMFSTTLGTLVVGTTAVGAAGVGIAVSGGTATVVGLAAAAAITSYYGATVMRDSYVGSCAYLETSCGSIATCDAYDGIDVKNTVRTGDLGGLTTQSIFGASNTPTIVDICAQNPCGVELASGGCVINLTDYYETNCISVQQADRAVCSALYDEYRSLGNTDGGLAKLSEQRTCMTAYRNKYNLPPPTLDWTPFL